MTPVSRPKIGDIASYNEGVQAVLDVARRSAEAIARTGKRRVHEDFAIAALNELAEAGRALLVVDMDFSDRRDSGHA